MTSAMFYKATNLIKITIEDFTTAVWASSFGILQQKYLKWKSCKTCVGHVLLGLVSALTCSLSITAVRGARFHSCKMAVACGKTLTDADGKVLLGSP